MTAAGLGTAPDACGFRYACPSKEDLGSKSYSRDGFWYLKTARFGYLDVKAFAVLLLQECNLGNPRALRV